MTRKIVTGVIAAILLVAIAAFAAGKAMEKARVSAQFGWHGRLLDQLTEAYKANDRDKMGEIISKMQERRENLGKFAKLNKWHKWGHRRMMGQMGPGCGQGQQMAGPGFRGCAMRGQGQKQGCQMAGPQCGKFQAMRGRGFGGCNKMMGNCGLMAGGFGQMPCQQGGMGTGKCMPQQNGPGQMPGCGRGFQKNCAPGQNAGDMEPQGCNMPRREKQNNVPPPEWGW